jgi:hypothetical protein
MTDADILYNFYIYIFLKNIDILLMFNHTASNLTLSLTVSSIIRFYII